MIQLDIPKLSKERIRYGKPAFDYTADVQATSIIYLFLFLSSTHL